MAKVEHFEIPADDVPRAAAFYREVFAFGYEPWGDSNMGMLRATEGGISGDLHPRSDAPHPTVVFTVDNIEETIAAVIANGGAQFTDIQPLGETSRWAYVKDSEGNIVGIYDEAPTAS
jgi:uncharacterized protein